MLRGGAWESQQPTKWGVKKICKKTRAAAT